MKSNLVAPQLNPTLWRTCKMLAGHRRIQLLRQLYENPGRSVSALGQAVGIKRACASQELRRIQSRGLLKAKRLGLPLVYRMDPDLQVSSAKSLLKAIQTAFATNPPERDFEMCNLATGLAHERRIAIARMLQDRPCTVADLQARLNLSSFALTHHLRPLMKAGFAEQRNGVIYSNLPAHPLARVLVSLLQQNH